MRHLFILPLFITSFCFSQNKSGKIILDSQTKLPVDYVYVASNDNKITLISNAEGRLIILDNLKIKYFTFYKIGYDALQVSMEDINARDTIFMTARPFKLNEVTISAEPLQAIIKDKKHYVDDYVVLPNNDFLVLLSGIAEHVKFFEVAYYKKDYGITHSKRIYGESEYFLFTDCFKSIHVVTEKHSRQVFFSSDSTFDFLPKYTRAKFDSTLALCALKIDTSLIFKAYPPPKLIEGAFINSHANAPIFTYVKISRKRKNIFYLVAFNKQLREMYYSEIPDSKAIQTSIDDAGGRRPSNESYAAASDLFFQKVAKPIYAPIFLKNDTVVIFNFQEELIVFLNKDNVVLKEVKMNSKDISLYRDFEMIYDEPQQKFYFKTKGYDKAYLGLFDIYTGSFTKTIHLEKPFAKNIQILNNRIYYLVKEKEWDDTCYLFEQKM